MFARLKRGLNFIGQKFLLAQCAVCFEVIEFPLVVCLPCQQKLPLISSPQCIHCGRPFDHGPVDHPCGECSSHTFTWHRSLYEYQDPILSLIHGLKYAGHLHLIDFFGQQLFRKFQTEIASMDWIIPVPLSQTKLGQRTFNQSLELAKNITKQSGVATLKHHLIKKHDTPAQAGLDLSERLKNLRGVFDWQGGRHVLTGKRVLLVDDVFTSGSTLHSCAQTLKATGAAEVCALTVALTPKWS